MDVERVCQGTEFFHEIWASLLSVILAVIIIYSQVRLCVFAAIQKPAPSISNYHSQATWPAFLPLILTAMLIVAASRISKHMGKQQGAWLAATDKRVKFLSSIINKFLPIKWSNYEDVLAQRVAELRADEMKEAKSFLYVTYLFLFSILTKITLNHAIAVTSQPLRCSLSAADPCAHLSCWDHMPLWQDIPVMVYSIPSGCSRS